MRSAAVPSARAGHDQGMPWIVDATISGVALVVLSPLLLLVAALIRWGSRGPVLYRQQRMGRGGRPFMIWKFRTMVVDAEAAGKLTVGSDVRVTRVGRLLRQRRLDEVPQLVNVLRGDMRLVGARPEVPEYLLPDNLDQRVVLRGRPGLTDPASLRYRNEATMLACSEQPERTYRTEVLPAKLRLSADYERRRTARSDLMVLFHTAVVVFRPAGDGAEATPAST